LTLDFVIVTSWKKEAMKRPTRTIVVIYASFAAVLGTLCQSHAAEASKEYGMYVWTQGKAVTNRTGLNPLDRIGLQ